MHTREARRSGEVGFGGWLPERPPLVTLRDARLLLRLPFLTLVAWFLPDRYWDTLFRRWAAISARLHRTRSARQRGKAEAFLGGHLGADPHGVITRAMASYNRERCQFLRCHRPGGWHPPIQLTGRDHIETALAKGRGGILWVVPMASSGLVAKIALHRAGFLITHLSRNEHGWGGSRFARAVLNPIVTRVEERHVAERLVMSPDDSFHALRTLVRRVRENNLVSMTVGSGGLHSYAVPLLNGTLRVADGAPVLARNTGAALLPVFTERREDGAYTVTVEKPLRISVDEDRSEAARAAVVELAKRLEPYVIARPDQYPAWDW